MNLTTATPILELGLFILLILVGALIVVGSIAWITCRPKKERNKSSS